MAPDSKDWKRPRRGEHTTGAPGDLASRLRVPSRRSAHYGPFPAARNTGVFIMMTQHARAWLVASLVMASLLPLSDAARAGSPSIDGVWSSLPSDVQRPSARREYVAINDVQRDRYLIFGGFGFQAPDAGGLFLEVWTLPLDSTSPAWSPLAIQGPTPGERHSPQVGYDPARQRMIIFGGYGHHYPAGVNEYLSDVWELQLDGTPAWTELHPTGTPPTGRLAGASIYDPLRQRLIVFGGTVGATVDTWQLDLSGNGDPAWSILPTQGTPTLAGYGMTAMYDPVRDRMVMFGGSTSDNYFGVHNDVWELTFSDPPTWDQLAPAGVLPSARRSLTSIYDAVRDRMVIFGGWDNLSDSTSSFLNDAWGLSLSGSPAWTQLKPEGTTPTGRDTHAAIYDAQADRLVVFGGWSGNQMLADTQFLDWGIAPAAAVLTPAAPHAEPSAAHLKWDVSNATGAQAAVFRREPGTKWSSIALVPRGASGDVTYDDAAVTPGGRYAYLVAVPSYRGEDFGGEVWVDVPRTVDSNGEFQFALEPLRPNPTVGPLNVTFTLADNAAARIDLYDVSGRLLLGREVGALGPGRHTLSLSSQDALASGMYFVRLSRAGQTLTRRGLVLAN